VTDAKAYGQMLKPFNLSPYDWILVGGWWGRKLVEDKDARSHYADLLSQSGEHDS
jgi:hypothetical protein